ncbi:MAG: small basic family protein [Armatimonadetes bacterium]|nr:small basic family protein [Armatimonadota bacterium]
MAVFPIIALILGVLLAQLVHVGPVTSVVGVYLAVACLAGFDTVIGGIRSGLEGKFQADIFITGFISNVLLAGFLAWLGDKISVNLFLASSLVFGGRIFLNLSLIRRLVVTHIQDWQKRRESAEAQQRAANMAATESNA